MEEIILRITEYQSVEQIQVSYSLGIFIYIPIKLRFWDISDLNQVSAGDNGGSKLGDKYCNSQICRRLRSL